MFLFDDTRIISSFSCMILRNLIRNSNVHKSYLCFFLSHWNNPKLIDTNFRISIHLRLTLTQENEKKKGKKTNSSFSLYQLLQM